MYNTYQGYQDEGGDGGGCALNIGIRVWADNQNLEKVAISYAIGNFMY